MYNSIKMSQLMLGYEQQEFLDSQNHDLQIYIVKNYLRF